MSDLHHPHIAPIAPVSTDDSRGAIEPEDLETPEPLPITEQEVGEYREQDRFLPVS